MYNKSFIYLLYRGLNKFNVYLPKPVAKLFAAIHTKYISDLEETKWIKLDTYDGSGQAVHPDVVSTEDFAGYRYWMAVTPYPFGVDYFENPSIFKSLDGVNWHSEGNKPIAFPTQRKKAHLSDPDLIYEEKGKQLRLFYRETRFVNETLLNNIYTTVSTDGLHWTCPVLILTSDKDECLSPSAVSYGEAVDVFYVSTLNNRYQLRKKRFLYDSFNVIEDVICQINNIPSNRLLWHVDIIRLNEKLLGVFVFASDQSGNGSKIYFGNSMDCGIMWNIKDEIIEQETAVKFQNIYRGCLVPTEEKSIFNLYYSAQLRDNSWYVFYRPRFTIE